MASESPPAPPTPTPYVSNNSPCPPFFVNCWERNFQEDQTRTTKNGEKQARRVRESIAKAPEGFSSFGKGWFGFAEAPLPTPSVVPPPPPSNPPPPSPSDPPPSSPSNPNSPPSNPSNPDPPPSNPTPIWTPNQSSPPLPPHRSSFISAPLVVGVVAGGVILVGLVTLFLVFCWRKKRRVDADIYMPYPIRHYPQPAVHQPEPYKDDPYDIVKMSSDPQPMTPQIDHSGGSGSNYSTGDPHPPMKGLIKSTFTYEELLLATNGFAVSNLLGQGGFGYVHKGVLPNGKEIAVKQLKRGSGQGETEFQAEVDIISRVHHKHLVSLIGYCTSGDKRLLVYEYVANNTLEFHLHGKGRPTLDWSTRMKIALGAAKGLSYLHEDCHPKIIHRDIKASNILLDYKFEAKVADFGLAKLANDNNTHVSTRVMGTFGYLAPEYASSGQLTDKSDVFSFGVMLLELITGRRPVDTSMDDSLVDWAKPLIARAQDEGNCKGLVDPRLGNNLNANEVMSVITCAAACVRSSAKRRPRMSQVVRSLEGDISLEDIGKAIMPVHRSFFDSDNDSSNYNEDMNKFRKMGTQSNEYQSSQYSAPTGEFGQNPNGSSSEMEMGKMKNNMDSYQFKSEGY